MNSHYTRRQMLEAGVLGSFGLTLPKLLRAETDNRVVGENRPAAKAKSVILLWLQGGVSHHDTLDPKPDAPSEIRGEYATISTRVPSVLFSEKMPKMADMLDQYALIRSVTHREAAHERGSMYMTEGRRPPPNTGVAPSGNPQFGSLVAHQLGMRNGVPPFVSHPGNDFTTKFTGTGWLPRSSAPFRGFEVGMLQRRENEGNSLEARDALMRHMERQSAVSGLPQNWDRFRQQAVDILTSGNAAEAFDISKESEATLQLYGIATTSAGRRSGDKTPEYALAARRLVEAGVRFVTIGRDSWDHHANIYPQLKGRLPMFDAVWTGLITDLKQRGLFDETLVVYLTEYGRTPTINKDAGRDHWPQAFSVAFAGAGIRPGAVHGMSDKRGAEVVDNPVSPEQIAATIFHLLGLSADDIVTRTDGRPNALIEEADPIRQILR